MRNHLDRQFECSGHGRRTVRCDNVTDPEIPEPPMNSAERRTERKRLRGVRKERRRLQIEAKRLNLRDKKGKGSGGKKGKKGK